MAYTIKITYTFILTTMIEPIFTCNKTQKHFDTFGFAKINLLNDEQIESLLNTYNKYFLNKELKHFTSTNFIPQKTERFSISNEILATIAPSINDNLSNIKLWNAAFLIKPVGNDTEFKLHQDWTFVDEENFYSGNIWMPLHDTNEKNGTLYLIPKSHYKQINTFRAQTIHELFFEKEEILKPYCVPLNIKKGEALIFQHSIIHYSSANRSNSNRIAVVCGFNSSKATLKTYFRINETEAEEYIMPDNFVFDFEDGQSLNNKPNGTFIKKITIPHQTYINSQEDLISHFIK